MASYISTPNFLPRSIAAPTGLQALPFPWFLQGLCPNTFPCQSFVYSPPAIPAVTAPVLQHGVFDWASPVSPNQTNKSFMIRDILGTTDLASSHTTAHATGKSKIYFVF